MNFIYRLLNLTYLDLGEFKSMKKPNIKTTNYRPCFKSFLFKNHIFALFLTIAIVLITQVSIAEDTDEVSNHTILGEAILGKTRLGEPPLRVVPEDIKASLFKAAKKGDVETIQFLLNQGIGVDLSDEQNLNQTALMVAAIYNQKEVITFLLKARAKVDLQDNAGNTALIYAAEQIEITKLLVEAGANIHLKNNNGYTALMFALRNRSRKTFDFLLDAGSDAHCLYALLHSDQKLPSSISSL